MNRARLSLLVAVAACARAAPGPATASLRLERAVPLSGPGDFQPSGLAFRRGILYTVSDKASDALLEIELDRGEARPTWPIHFPEGARTDLDLEGLAVDHGGAFLVVSEALGRVFRVDADGRAAWLPPDFAGPARAAGLLATPGAGFEGIAVLDDGLVLAAEREPRGLVTWRAGVMRAWQMERTRVPPPPGRRRDFADLAVDHGRLFALVRNADAIAELVPAGERFEEGRWWSFAEAVARFPYEDQRFGMAEGLAFDAGHVYVVLDNNGSPRRGAPSDHRAMLFVFQRPTDL